MYCRGVDKIVIFMLISHKMRLGLALRVFNKEKSQDTVRKRGEVAIAPGEGNGTPLQYSCLENPMDGGAW